MAPACILLDRNVTICDHPQDLESDPLRGGGAAGVVGGTTETSSEPRSVKDIGAAVAKYLRAMKPDLQFVDPPGVSSLTAVRPLSSNPIPKYRRRVPSGFVATADKNLVLLYAGSYRPASSYDGYYMLFDAASSSLSTIPGVHCTSSYTFAGYGTVIAAREGGAFLLAELLFNFRRPPAPAQGMLCLWQGSEWAYKVGQLPARVCHPWRVHMSFSVQGKTNTLFCWVDLLHGLLLCDIERRYCEEVDSSSDLLDMSFVPLPDNCSISEKHPQRLNPQDFRTMACVDGTIKFLTMDGFVEGGPISLVTYTLDLDGTLPSWTKDTVLPLDDLWADDSFISTGAPPRITPLFPILSTQEHDVVYLVVPGNVDREDGCLIWRVQLLLSIDTRKKKVISVDQQNCPTLLSSRYLLAFSASQQGLKYHQVQKLQINKNGSESASNNYTSQKTERWKQLGWGQVEKKMKFELPPQLNGVKLML